jgi:hypothetical protein
MARVAAMQTFKLLMQTVVNEDASFMTIDIKDFYIQHALKEFEYMRVNRKHVPQEIIDKFNLEQFFVNDTIYFEVRKTMYGLPQAGRLAQEELFVYSLSIALISKLAPSPRTCTRHGTPTKTKMSDSARPSTFLRLSRRKTFTKSSKSVELFNGIQEQ